MTTGRSHWAEGATARRTSPRPTGWKALRQQVLDRDGHQCTWHHAGQRCPTTTELEVDHIGDPNDHSLDNLRTLCKPHHASKTGGDAARARWQRQPTRTARPHPGLRG